MISSKCSEVPQWPETLVANGNNSIARNWNRFLSTNSGTHNYSFLAFMNDDYVLTNLYRAEEMLKSMQFSFNDLKLRGFAGIFHFV